jgi:hypothetical protein
MGKMDKSLKILPADELGLLLFQIDQLPYNEARLLEAELQETYRQCLDKWYELEILVKTIRNKTSSQRKKEENARSN